MTIRRRGSPHPFITIYVGSPTTEDKEKPVPRQTYAKDLTPYKKCLHEK
ncbi:hypothetical protein [Psychrobacter celer]